MNTMFVTARHLVIIIFLAISSLALGSSQQNSCQFAFPTIQDLIEKPVEVHNQIEKNLNSFERMDPKKMQEELRKYPQEEWGKIAILLGEHRLREYQQKNGLTLQSECTTKDCPLSRINNPSYRAQFEETVSKKILKFLQPNPQTQAEPKAKKQPAVQYVTFASGSRFMDLIIMAKVLSKKPDATIAIHFIDPIYEPYKVLKNVITTAPLNTVDFNEIKEKIKFTPTPESVDLWEKAFTLHQKFQEFVLYLKNNFPQSTIILYVYCDIEKYLELVDTNKIPPADVTAAADLESDEANYNYALLAERTLIKNLNSNHTLLLIRNSKSLHTLYLAPRAQTPLYTFKNKKNDELQLALLSE